MTQALNQKFRGADRDYAVNLVHSVCCLAGDSEFFNDRGTRGKSSLAAAVERHDTARLFEWLVGVMTYQGIADRIAQDYMQRHGQARWAGIEASLAATPSCPKLKSYWQFEGCRHQKGAESCAEPKHIDFEPLIVLGWVRAWHWCQLRQLSEVLGGCCEKDLIGRTIRCS
jgi:hypothetical protein